MTKLSKGAPKAIKGYWSNGRFVKPEEIALEEVGPPSKTMLKAEADEKQALGEALLTLRADLMARLDLPTKLLDAIKDAKKITNFEGKRRQMQFIGKLMRPLDADPIREAINEQLNGSAELTRSSCAHWFARPAKTTNPKSPAKHRVTASLTERFFSWSKRKCRLLMSQRYE